MRSFFLLVLINIFTTTVSATDFSAIRKIECGDHWLSANLVITGHSTATLYISGDSGIEIEGIARFNIIRTADGKSFLSATLDDFPHWVHLDIDLTDAPRLIPAELQLDHSDDIRQTNCFVY